MAEVTESQSTNAIHAAAKSMGYVELRAHQKTAIKSFVAGNDVFVAIPTGGGKSLCYSLLPVVFDRIRGHTADIAKNLCPQCRMRTTSCRLQNCE